MAKKRALPYHIMPDGTMMPGATHEQYMQQESAPQKPVKRKGGKKAVKMGKGPPMIGGVGGGKMSPVKPVMAPGKGGKGGKGKGGGGSGKHNLV